MTGGDPLFMLVAFVATAAGAGLAFVALRHAARVTRAPSGRPYVEVVRDLYDETTRRSILLVEAAEAREGRLARLERR